MNWIFKQDLVQNNSRIVIFQKRNFTGKKNEKIITISNKNGKWFFEKLYLISDIKIISDKSHNAISLELKEIENFEEKKVLDDYLYSIRRITNFKKPYVHFKRKYNKLDDIELQAIVNDEIYFERTYFGVIINSLPIEHVKSFLYYISNRNISFLVDKTDSTEALRLLLQYLEDFIINPSRILVKTGEIMRDVIAREHIFDIGFSDESGAKNLILPQIEMINEILKEYETLIDKINYDAQTQGRSFKNHFKNSKLPIQL